MSTISIAKFAISALKNEKPHVRAIQFDVCTDRPLTPPSAVLNQRSRGDLDIDRVRRRGFRRVGDICALLTLSGVSLNRFQDTGTCRIDQYPANRVSGPGRCALNRAYRCRFTVPPKHREPFGRRSSMGTLTSNIALLWYAHWTVSMPFRRAHADRSF